MKGYCCTVVVAANGAAEAVVVAFSFVVPRDVSEGALLNLELAYPREPLVSWGSYCGGCKLCGRTTAADGLTEYGP